MPRGRRASICWQKPQAGFQSRSAGRGLREFKDSVTSFKKPTEEVTDVVTLDKVKDIASLRSPKTALARILSDKPNETKKDEARTET